MKRLVGLGVSHGIGRGKVVFLRRSQPLARIELSDADVADEVRRFRTALDHARDELRKLSRAGAQQPDHTVSDIFSAHLLILDSSFVQKTETNIRNQKVNAEWALKTVLGDYSAKQGSLADSQFRDKYLDIEDVANRVSRALRGTGPMVSVDPDTIVVARELRPSAVIEIAKQKPAGLITEIGGWTSHMSIIAREFRLPMVTGIKNAEKILSPGDPVVVDGDTGEVLLGTDGSAGVRGYRRSAVHTSVEPHTSARVTTTDGVEILIKANAEDPDTYRTAEGLGARGIGLYRSELLIPGNGILPDEDRQAAAYAEIAKATGEFGVAIRTFDFSPDQFTREEPPLERNPALGLRAIRAGLADSDFFKTQIRAILRASSAGNVDIVLPMISNIDEIIKAKSLISSVRQELEIEGIAFGETRIGFMIEVPSTVFLAARITRHVDFLCLGTNDLVQYLLAVDRDNDAVASWYQTLNPAVISAIRIVVVAAADSGIPTTVCGEMAGSPFYVPVLIGLGAQELSINTTSIQPVIKLISGISAEAARDLVRSLDENETAEENELLLSQYYLQNWKDLFPPGLITSKHR